MPLEGYGGNGAAGAKGDKGDTGPQGPTPVTVRIPGSLTTSSGTQTILSSVGRLAAAKTIPANTIQITFGTGYSASNSSNWLLTPGYMTPGNPGSFTAIGSGRRNDVAGGAIVARHTETYSHPEVTVPQGAVMAATMTPTNFPSPNAGYADTVIEYFQLP